MPDQRFLKILFLLLSLGLGMGFLWQGLKLDDQQSQQALVGTQLRSFEMAPLFEQHNKVSAQHLHGKPYTLVNLWASWCGVCKQEHQFLNQLAEQGINIVGVNYRDDRLAAQQVIRDTGNPYQTIIYDPQGQLALELGVIGTPENYLIDDKGYIVQRHSGAIDQSIWNAKFASFLAKEQP